MAEQAKQLTTLLRFRCRVAAAAAAAVLLRSRGRLVLCSCSGSRSLWTSSACSLIQEISCSFGLPTSAVCPRLWWSQLGLRRPLLSVASCSAPDPSAIAFGTRSSGGIGRVWRRWRLLREASASLRGHRRRKGRSAVSKISGSRRSGTITLGTAHVGKINSILEFP